MTTQTRFTPGPWAVEWPVGAGLGLIRPGIEAAGEFSVVLVGADDDDAGIYGYTPQEQDANAHLIAAAPRLYAAMEELTEWHAWSLEYSEEAAAEFYRETGMLAPFKDAGAIANMAEELHASRAEEWRAWCKRKNDALVSEARAALAQARGEP